MVNPFIKKKANLTKTPNFKQSVKLCSGLWVPNNGVKSKLLKNEVVEIFGVCFYLSLSNLIFKAADAGSNRVFGVLLDVFLISTLEPQLFIAIRRLELSSKPLAEYHIPTLIPRPVQTIQVFPLNFRSYRIELPADIFTFEGVIYKLPEI
jgi:hypothetical protein